MPKKYVDGVLTDTSDWDNEQAARDIAAEPSADTLNAKYNREERDRRLAETDYLAFTDNTMTSEMQSYRQALRDIPSQSGFPTNVTWPTKP